MVWLFWGQASEPEPMYCGVGSGPEVPEKVKARWAVLDPARLAPWRERLGTKPDRDLGKNLFKGNCAACHKPDRDMSGPALQGILDRAPQPALDWYIAFMTNSEMLINAGEPYTLAVRERWGNSLWLHPNDLIRKERLDVLVYVELVEVGAVRQGGVAKGGGHLNLCVRQTGSVYLFAAATASTSLRYIASSYPLTALTKTTPCRKDHAPLSGFRSLYVMLANAYLTRTTSRASLN